MNSFSYLQARPHAFPHVSKMQYFNAVVLLISLSATTTHAYEISEAELAKWMTYDTVDPSNCVQPNTHICNSCQSSALCLQIGGVFVAYEAVCTGTDVCNIGTDGEAICTSFPTTGDGMKCKCGSGSTGTTYQADPYSKSHYTMCVGGNPYYIDCGDLTYLDSAKQCVEIPPPEPCTEVGVLPDVNDCSYYHICTSIGAQPIVDKCNPNLYYNPDEKDCRPIPTVPFQCGTGNTGAFGDPINCSIYHICSSGQLIATETCPADQIYSDQNKGCISDDGSCTSLEYCRF